ERVEIHSKVIRRRYWNWRNTGTGCYDLPGEQSVTEVTEFVCDPGERDAGVAENISAASGGSVFEVSVALNLVLREIQITPSRFYRRAPDKTKHHSGFWTHILGSDDRVVLQYCVQDHNPTIHN